mgnify:CR=1 FL=1
MCEYNYLLVPGDYYVGSRTRIIASLMMGLPVIAHSSVTAGVPEFKVMEGIHLYTSSEEFHHIISEIKPISKQKRQKIRKSAIDFNQQNINSWFSEIIC